jgi:hypothetical protein
MEKMKVTGINSSGGYELEASNSRSSCRCTISNLRLHDTEPMLSTEVVWHDKGTYTNGQRKKLLARTVVNLLRSAIEYHKRLDKHSKGKS